MMNQSDLSNIVLRAVLTELAKVGEYFVPVTSSNRHVHLSQADVERLFGPGYQLTKMRNLLQPGQYACNETVMLETPKGKTTLRVVGPTRKETQIELSYTDCYKLGLDPVLRMSGETSGTPGGVLVSQDRRITLPEGIQVAKRHLHLSPEESAAYGLRDGDAVTLLVEGPRAAKLDNLVVRTGHGHSLEAHIDKDEANACGVRDGQLCRILLGKAAARAAVPEQSQAPAPMPVLHTYVPPAPPSPAQGAPATGGPSQPIEQKRLNLTGDPHCFLCEEDVLAAYAKGYRQIECPKGAILTPLARDLASSKGITLILRT